MHVDLVDDHRARDVAAGLIAVDRIVQQVAAHHQIQAHRDDALVALGEEGRRDLPAVGRDEDHLPLDGAYQHIVEEATALRSEDLAAHEAELAVLGSTLR